VSCPRGGTRHTGCLARTQEQLLPTLHVCPVSSSQYNAPVQYVWSVVLPLPSPPARHLYVVHDLPLGASLDVLQHVSCLLQLHPQLLLPTRTAPSISPGTALSQAHRRATTSEPIINVALPVLDLLLAVIHTLFHKFHLAVTCSCVSATPVKHPWPPPPFSKASGIALMLTRRSGLFSVFGRSRRAGPRSR
jgi:hypothetical protein